MIDERQSYLTHPDGTQIQVLKPTTIRDPDTGHLVDSVEWDEPATHAAYAAHVAAHGTGLP